MSKPSIDLSKLQARREAEMALLGALLIEGSSQDENAIAEVKTKLSPDNFLEDIHSRIFKAMTNCKCPHTIAVAEELYREGKLEQGDCAYLSFLVSICPCSLDYMDYAKTVLYYLIDEIKPKYKDGIK